MVSTGEHVVASRLKTTYMMIVTISDSLWTASEAVSLDVSFLRGPPEDNIQNQRWEIRGWDKV